MAKYLSLSFDDGPCNATPDTMTDALNLIEKHGVLASFFLIGNKITEENKKVIRRAFDMGCDIENHTWTHPDMTKLSSEQMRDEYDRCDKAIIEITGKKPEFFRPPYISVNQTMYDTIKVPFICGLGSRDWEPEVPMEERLRLMREGTQDGIIYLLHCNEGNDKTLQALDILIPEMKAQDYTFVTVPEMFRIKGVKEPVRNENWTLVE